MLAMEIYLILVVPLMLPSKSYVGWTVLVVQYGNRMAYYRGPEERAFHGLDLMMLAMTVYYMGLRYRRKFGEYVIRYWFFVIFIGSVLWPPGYNGRIDVTPPVDESLRLR